MGAKERKEKWARCPRCGITVSAPGLVCRDCNLVDPRFSAVLREQEQRRLAAEKAADDLLSGITFVGTTAATRSRERDKGRKR